MDNNNTCTVILHVAQSTNSEDNTSDVIIHMETIEIPPINALEIEHMNSNASSSFTTPDKFNDSSTF